MAWKEIDGRGLTVEQFAIHVANLNFTDWRPSFVVVHNTGNPSLNPLPNHGSWHGSSTPPEKRVRESLVKYYRDTQRWPAGPHLFIDDEYIWLFTPLTTAGVHSPSWNGVALGFEMVGDYNIESFNADGGAKVRDNTIAALAIVHAKLGIDPEKIRIHKEDPKTNHDCPGKNVGKSDLIHRVQEYMAHGGGEHTVVNEADIAPDVERAGTVIIDGLNVRVLSSASASIITTLQKGFGVVIQGEVTNGMTKWYRIKSPAGWVSARFVQT